MEKISCLGDTCAKTLDMNILKRLQAKELIFSHALAGERMKAIKMIPRLFRGSPSLEELSKGVAVGSMALFIPARLYPEIVGACRFLKRLKNVTHR